MSTEDSGPPRRFRDSHDTIPDISDRLLWLRLKELERADLIVREVHTGRPVQVVCRPERMGSSPASGAS